MDIIAPTAVGTTLQQHFYTVGIPCKHGIIQGGPVFHIYFRIDVETFLAGKSFEEESEYVHVPVLGSEHQCRTPYIEPFGQFCGMPYGDRGKLGFGLGLIVVDDIMTLVHHLL
jgi:hypothetical protein